MNGTLETIYGRQHRPRAERARRGRARRERRGRTRVVRAHGPLQVKLDGDSTLRFERRYGYPAERVCLLVGTFWDTPVRFELKEDGDGCHLTFTHNFPDPDEAAKTAAGWDRCFTRMDALLAGSTLGEEDSIELWSVVHERYAEEMGIDLEVGRQAMKER